MPSPTVYLVTGANRGLGLGLVKILAARPDVVVFAGARNPAATSLVELATAHPNLHPIKFTLANESDNAAAVAEIERTVGRLDVVIANAGVYTGTPSVGELSIAVLREHLEGNTVGMTVLFQATHKLLLASPTGAPVFAFITSSLSSLANHLTFGASAYAASKVACNFLIRELDAQYPQLVAMTIYPGWSKTEMGNEHAQNMGMPEAPIEVQDSVEGILSRVDGATKEKSSGRFWAWRAAEGRYEFPTGEVPW
ncbi:NAD(P)-binding protein [Mycena kentingensis (nom. inval.)]|nr:NAD(P)-binding protein [Mycena kentingensis (nom. inval.)]